MKLINNFLLLTFSIIICYFILICGDKLLHTYLISNGIYSNSVNKVISRKKMDADIKFAKSMEAKGYLPPSYPIHMDNYNKLRKFSIKNEIVQIAGFPNTLTYLCTEGNHSASYLSDRFGFRNLDDNWNKSVDTVFIGDSFVHGACVDDNSTIPSLYAKKTGDNTLNLGFSANNSTHYETYSYLFIPKFRPKKVFIVFYSNDRGYVQSSLLKDYYVNTKKPYFSNKSLQPLRQWTKKEINNSLLKLNYEANNTSSMILINKLRNAFKNRRYLPTIQLILGLNTGIDVSSSKNALIKSKELCIHFGCELNAIYIPNSIFSNPDSFADSYSHKLKKVATELGIHFFDFSNLLDRFEGSIDYGETGMHLSPAGYKKVVNHILN